MKTLLKCLVGSIFFSSLCASAQDGNSEMPMRVGLWEVSATVEMTPGMQAGTASGSVTGGLLDRLTSGQKTFLEGILSRKGIQVQPNGTGTQRFCVSQTMSNANEYPHTRTECQRTVTRQGQQLMIAFECASPVAKGQIFVFQNGPELYLMNMVANGASSADKLSVKSTGKFLSPDCGALRPAR